MRPRLCCSRLSQPQFQSLAFVGQMREEKDAEDWDEAAEEAQLVLPQPPPRSGLEEPQISDPSTSHTSPHYFPLKPGAFPLSPAYPASWNELQTHQVGSPLAHPKLSPPPTLFSFPPPPRFLFSIKT